MTSYHMIKEIREQPEAFRKILKDTRSTIMEIAKKASMDKRPETFYLTGCGSSYYAAMIPAFQYEHNLRLDGRAVPSSEFVWYGAGKGSRSPMLITLSRSGKTSESVEAIRKAKEARIPTVAVTSDPTSTMSRECDYNLDTGVPNEQSFIMTKTFTGAALCCTLLGLELAKLHTGPTVSPAFEGELARIPNDAETVVNMVEDQSRKIAESTDASRFIYLGSGANWGSCLEGALKLRETSYVGSEAYHTMEFRHGPFAELEKGIHVFALVPKGRSIQEQLTILTEIAGTGATVVPISNDPEVLRNFGSSIRMPDSIGSEFASILYMIPMQFFAYYYSVKHGKNPDEPRNLTKYVTTEIKS